MIALVAGKSLSPVGGFEGLKWVELLKFLTFFLVYNNILV